jgi:hypothetical protein
VASKRPCKICRKWFQPDPRAGPRQRTCSRPQCQRERHRRSCASWHHCNPDYDRETRLRGRLAQTRPKSGESDLVSWPAARDAVGLEVLILLEEFRQLLVDFVRDAVARQAMVFKGKSVQVSQSACETASTPPARPP